MLYRTLIVDDEPYIVHYMRQLLDTITELDLEVFTACCADEALEICNRQKIDILLADIRMPGMTGLELSKRVKRQWPACKTILLTAHAEFELAQQALAMGVVSYILKTATDAHIVSELRRVAGLIDAELDQSGVLAESGAFARAASPRRQKQAFFCLLRNRGEFGLADIKTAMGELGFIDASRAPIVLAGRVCHFDDKQARPPEYTVKLLFSNIIAPSLEAYACEDLNDWILWLIQPSPRMGENPVKWLIDMLESLSDSCQKTAGIAVSLLLCHGVPSLMRLPDAYEACMRAGEQIGYDKENYVYAFALQDAPSKDAGSTNAFINFSGNVIRTMTEYLDKHIFDDVSLQRLSELTGYNPSYVSRVFSEQTGENLKSYIARGRLTQIARMMRDSSLSLKDIASIARFENRSYFNRFIKRLTGMPPQQYRDSLTQGDTV